MVFVRRLLYRLRMFRSYRAGVPVIVVGNLIAGGSGKTPLVLWLAEFLKDHGWTPGIVSRGYVEYIAAELSLRPPLVVSGH